MQCNKSGLDLRRALIPQSQDNDLSPNHGNHVPQDPKIDLSLC